jgi:hypothetical protein
MQNKQEFIYDAIEIMPADLPQLGNPVKECSYERQNSDAIVIVTTELDMLFPRTTTGNSETHHQVVAHWTTPVFEPNNSEVEQASQQKQNITMDISRNSTMQHSEDESRRVLATSTTPEYQPTNKDSLHPEDTQAKGEATLSPTTIDPKIQE